MALKFVGRFLIPVSYTLLDVYKRQTGARLVFDQNVFDTMCSDLGAVRLSRAAAASSAVPVVLTPVTLNNYCLLYTSRCV